MSEATLARRGFHRKDDTTKELLERIGQTFLGGFAEGVAADRPEQATPRLNTQPPRFRGFAYEGAAMGLAVADAVSRRRSRFGTFLGGSGQDHVYMAHVGLGWALARLPRTRWPRSTPDPLLQWLVLDGYGFHQAYFHTDRVVRRQVPHGEVRWGNSHFRTYRVRAMDQGVGRALWFVGGTDPDVVADLIDRFDPGRRPDLYSGVGLAATYAGGADAGELGRLLDRAGRMWPLVAQGSTFAAEARRLAGTEVPETDLATKVLCGLSASDAAQVARDQRLLSLTPEIGVPRYETWRCRIADQFESPRRT
jgi:enediyne biosynthesis protein E3